MIKPTTSTRPDNTPYIDIAPRVNPAIQRPAMWLVAVLIATHAFGTPPADRPITLRVHGLPDINSAAFTTIEVQVAKAILAEFHRLHPQIKVLRSTGIMIEDRAAEFLPLMQIAGDIAPHVFEVRFHNASTYIEQGFLYPIDQIATVTDEERKQIPNQLWPVIKRRGPPGDKEHIYCWPIQLQVRALCYRRDLFQEAGLPDRAPNDWNELMMFARKLTDPGKQRSGIALRFGDEGSYHWLPYLWSAGGEAMSQDAEGNWRCTFDSDAAAQAALFFTKIRRQRWLKQYEINGEMVEKKLMGVTYGEADRFLVWFAGKIGMFQIRLGFDQMTQIRNPELHGIGPMPLGPAGVRGSDLNATMLAIYSGIEDPRVREAAWKYISFWMRPTAQKIMVETMIKNGYGRFVQPQLLEKFGYHEYVRLIPESWRKTFEESVKNGKPAPYGRNSQQIYRWMTKPLGAIARDDEIQDAINKGDDEAALAKIKDILRHGVSEANEKMLGLVHPEERQFRRRVALLVTIGIAAIFGAGFFYIWRIFAPPEFFSGAGKGGWQFRKYKVAYLLLAPGVGTIALWQYWPLLHGGAMAFQDYRVTGDAQWVGLGNFAEILFDRAFWLSVWVGLKYAFLVLLFGFPAPIILAILLQEVPRGKIIFRSIYYLPAVISGVLVIFLWKTFFGPFGLINELRNAVGLDGHTNWLAEPRWALVCCVVPVVWAGMGPGCLIYLAALKTVPDELYESASIDGASIWTRITRITLPSLKTLILINLIGAVIASFQSANFILAMTGGGPWTGYGRTEVVGLHIFSTAFFYLRFGVATAMAWIVGLMLIGFTLIQLRKLRHMEFRTAG